MEREPGDDEDDDDDDEEEEEDDHDSDDGVWSEEDYQESFNETTGESGGEDRQPGDTKTTRGTVAPAEENEEYAHHSLQSAVQQYREQASYLTV